MKRKRHRRVLESFNDLQLGKTVIIYHRTDWDGYTSGAVALKAIPNADLLGYGYNDPLPVVNNYDTIVLVDLTIPDRNWMVENADKLIWIDHHADAISRVNKDGIEGIREDGIGACLLAWQYFFPDQEIPLHVALIATYDIFRKDGKYVSWEDAYYYQLVMGQYSKDAFKGPDRSPEFVEMSLKFIDEPMAETIERVSYGEELEIDRAKNEEELFKTAEYVENDGITICKLIADGQPALLIKNHSDAHTADLFALRSTRLTRNKPGKYKISLRVPANSNIDASKIARQFDGNGHVKAAGCYMTQEEFDNIQNYI